jgi:hypothetical protein
MDDPHRPPPLADHLVFQAKRSTGVTRATSSVRVVTSWRRSRSTGLTCGPQCAWQRPAIGERLSIEGPGVPIMGNS